MNVNTSELFVPCGNLKIPFQIEHSFSHGNYKIKNIMEIREIEYNYDFYCIMCI